MKYSYAVVRIKRRVYVVLVVEAPILFRVEVILNNSL